MVVQFSLQIVELIGYLGIVFLMTLESVGIPIPSEVVMPAGGWLASDGTLNLYLVTFAGTLGCVIGSTIAYWIGLKGGRTTVLRYGHYFFLNEGHLDSTERWFKKYGAITIFLTRLLPIVRTYISFPAGMAKMKFWPFITLTAIGSAIWCFALAYIGYILGPNWNSISGNFNLLTTVVAVGLVLIFVTWFSLKYLKKRNLSKGE